jgi:hypothetical protein
MDPCPPHYFIEERVARNEWRRIHPALTFEAAVMQAKRMASLRRNSMRLVRVS